MYKLVVLSYYKRILRLNDFSTSWANDFFLYVLEVISFSFSHTYLCILIAIRVSICNFGIYGLAKLIDRGI